MSDDDKKEIQYNKDFIEIVNNFALNNDFDVVKNYSKTLPPFIDKQTHYTIYHDWEHDINNKIEDPLVVESMYNLQENIIEYLKNDYLPKHNLKFVSFKHKPRDLEISRTTSNFILFPHTDGYESAQPFPHIFLTSVLYLNDDYNGGEISFPDHEKTIGPATNNLITFPSHFQHEVFKVLDKEVPFVYRCVMVFIFYCCVESLV
jgi:hypothetical protein